MHTDISMGGHQIHPQKISPGSEKPVRTENSEAMEEKPMERKRRKCVLENIFLHRKDKEEAKEF